MIIPPKFALFECANMDYLIRDIENERFLNRKEEVELLNDLSVANEHLCNILSRTYNKKPENFDLIHKIKELEKENWKYERYIVDDCDSIIDIETREFYDYPEDICKVLNKQWNKIIEQKHRIQKLEGMLTMFEFIEDNSLIKQDLGGWNPVWIKFNKEEK